MRLSERLYSLAEQRTERRCGLSIFRYSTVYRLVQPGMRVLDVGGGKWPLIDQTTKRRLDLTITGLDVCAEELAAAPPGSYDRTIVGDVGTVTLTERYDLIVSQTVLEHVRDTRAAIANLSGALAEEGIMAHSLPCAYAGYTLLSRLLGNRLGPRLLWTLYPESRATSGFRAYYRECTPRRMRRLCEKAGLEQIDITPFFASEYFRFFVPLYAVELSRQLLLMRLGAENLCETFTVIARKPHRLARAGAASDAA